MTSNTVWEKTAATVRISDMPRLDKLDDILFPVGERPIFTRITTKSGEKFVRIPSQKAIVNTTTGNVLCVVSLGYRRVYNDQALKWASCCETVFSATKQDQQSILFLAVDVRWS